MATLKDFCIEVMDPAEDEAKVDPERTADEFVRFYSLPKIVTLGRLQGLAKFLGIKKISPNKLPESFRGYHFGSDGNYEIQYRQQDWVGSAEHTVLHEIYEIIEDTLDGLFVEFVRRQGTALERAADTFAASVLMQTEHFLSDVYEESLDVLKLQKNYGRAYSSIILRMKRVMNNRHSFFAVIYEPRIQNQVYVNEFGIVIDKKYFIENFVCRYLVKTSDIKPNRKHGRLLWCFLPRKKHHVMLDSVAYYVLTEQRSAFRERVEGFDMFGYDDLSIIARPVAWNGQISKVIVIGIPQKENQLLRGQIDRISPLMLYKSFQII